MKEADIQRSILDWLNRQPDTFAWKNSSTGIFDPRSVSWRKKSGFDLKGTSDIFCIFVEGVMFIEVKKPGGKKPTDEQKAFISKVNRTYGRNVAAWVDSLEAAQKFYHEVRYG